MWNSAASLRVCARTGQSVLFGVGRGAYATRIMSRNSCAEVPTKHTTNTISAPTLPADRGFFLGLRAPTENEYTEVKSNSALSED